MIARIWITVVPNADRPYCSTTQPSPERKELINKQGGKIFLANITLSGLGKTDDGSIEATAVEDTLPRARDGGSALCMDIAPASVACCVPPPQNKDEI